MKSNRTEIIYDIYSFLYREPQHIGKVGNKNSPQNTYDKAMAYLKTREVTLNHLSNLFFSFLPTSLLHTFFELSLKKPFVNDQYDVFVRSLDSVVQGIGDFTQPDIFFVWEKNVVSLEMKLWAKTSLDQLMKYAFLHHMEQKTSWVNKSYHLLYLGKWSFSSLREEKFQDVDCVKKAFMQYSLPEVSNKWKHKLAEHSDIIKQMVADMTISYITYADLYCFCEKHLDAMKDNYQIYKLLKWMMNELEERKLM